MSPTSSDSLRERLPLALALVSLGFVAVLVLHLAGRPIYTDDAWFHLAMGAVYATEGLWPAADPLLHTAHAHAPVQHEWLFGVAVYAIESVVGFHGLRLVHVLAVVATLWLAFSILRRETRWTVAACLGTSLFCVLAWGRLFQLRPDLVSIPAALATYRLLLAGEDVPSWGRVAATCLLFLVWANLHSLFALGPALLIAALLGCALRALLRVWLVFRAGASSESPRAGDDTRFARRIGVALGLGLLATLLNPRGIEQHLTFFSSSADAAIWSIADEWSHFDPFSWSGNRGGFSFLVWFLTDSILVAFLCASGARLVGFLRRPSATSLVRTSPVLFGLGLAACVALLVSTRFLWMSFFCLLFLGSVLRTTGAARPALRAPAAWVMAAGSVALAVAFPLWGGYGGAAAKLPARLRDYLASEYLTDKYYVDGVRFLAETGVEGNLFNSYWMGGFLAYRLAPKLRTFVDGRTEHYPSDVLRDYGRINSLSGTGESWRDVLDRRNVDVFFGVSYPSVPPEGVYTSAHLEGDPDWVLVSRSFRHAIYLRRGERNRENLDRIGAYYAHEGVPFDRERGLDVAAVLRGVPEWAAAHGMLPPDYQGLVSENPEFRALNTLAWIYALSGAYTEQLDLDRQATRLRPRAKAPRCRTIYALLRLGRVEEARAAARDLRRLDPVDPRSLALERIAADYARAGPDQRLLLLQRIPLSTGTDMGVLLRRFRGD